MSKKNLIKEALIEAKELERASIENAKDIMLESFTPNFVEFFKDVLNEEDKENFKDDPDVPDDEELDDEELKKEGNEHDLGKKPDPGRQGADPAVDDDEENQNQDMKEGNYDDVSGDATPEKGQAGLPAPKPKVKKVGKAGWEDEGASDVATEDPEGPLDALPGKKPATKQTGDGGWEEEHQGGSKLADTANADPEKNAERLPGVKKAKVVKEEDKKEDEEDKELDVPDELFDEGDESKIKGKDKDDDVDIKDDFDGDDDDVEINIDVEDDDDEKDSVDEIADVDIENDKDAEEEEDDEIDEGLYIRQEGRFKKITPAEYLKTRISTLEEERDTLVNAVKTLQGQLQETHLFNAKLAHLNKLYMSGVFTSPEKEHIAERLDECDSIGDVKSLYKTIISEIRDANPLDSFSKLIKEQRIKSGSKTENIHESKEISRMKRLVDYEFE